jgi:HlyD family secretion protein
MLKVITIVLAVGGSGAAVWTVFDARTERPETPPDLPAVLNPYSDSIGAAGFVEPASRSVRVAAPEAGIIQHVFVAVGDRIDAGGPLFQIDTRVMTAELAQARAAVEVARRKLTRLQAQPRREDVPPLEAAVERAQAESIRALEQFSRAQKLKAQGAATHSAILEHDAALKRGQADLAAAQSELDRLRAGAWIEDIRLAESELAAAEAQAGSMQARLDRCTVRSPIAGTVLKRNIEPGEFTATGSEPALVIGDVSTLHVRVHVDEEDAPRLLFGAAATALAPGTGRECPLRMLRIEPLAVPKTQLTASSVELVDTRVVEVVFEVVGTIDTLYPGQLVEVFIDATIPEADRQVR